MEVKKVEKMSVLKQQEINKEESEKTKQAEKMKQTDINKVMGDYFEIALAYMMLLPLDYRFAGKGFGGLPDDVKKDLIRKSVKYMGKESPELYGKSPLQMVCSGESDLLRDHLSSMFFSKGPKS